MEVAADHPGRQQFCGSYAGDPKADSMGAPWYFNGRPFANSGPGRTLRPLRRESRTQRVAASVDGDMLLGGPEVELARRDRASISLGCDGAGLGPFV